MIRSFSVTDTPQKRMRVGPDENECGTDMCGEVDPKHWHQVGKHSDLAGRNESQVFFFPVFSRLGFQNVGRNLFMIWRPQGVQF